MITRTETRTVREGENVGAIDWQGYDFRSHYNNYCTTEENQDAYCVSGIHQLRSIIVAFEEGKKVQTTTYGGSPRCGYGDVIEIGMYDGWPYWRPVPSVCVRNWDGSVTWQCFSSITDYRIVTDD